MAGFFFRWRSGFEGMVGVDIAEGMVRRPFLARDNAKHPCNVDRLRRISGPKICSKARRIRGKIDFLYSLLVFQHIPDFAVIGRHLHAVSELLVRTEPLTCNSILANKNLLYQWKTELPDFVLPRFLAPGHTENSPEFDGN